MECSLKTVFFFNALKHFSVTRGFHDSGITAFNVKIKHCIICILHFLSEILISLIANIQAQVCEVSVSLTAVKLEIMV